MLESVRRWKKRSVVQRWSKNLTAVLPPRDNNWCLNLICGSLNAPTLTAARWRRQKHEQSCAPMVVEQGLRRREEQSSGLSADSRRLINDEAADAPVPTVATWRRRMRKQGYVLMIVKQRQWQRQWGGCVDGTLAPMVARQRQWQRQWGGCADGTLAPMVARQRQWEGYADEALAMIDVYADEALALQRQWWRQSKRCTDEALALMATRQSQWEGGADEALTPRVTRQRAMEWMHCWSLHPVSKEGKRTAVLESIRRQDKKDKMVDSLETEAWLMQYQLLWPWLTQCQLLWPAQSKSRGSKKKNTKTSIRKNEKERRCLVRLKKKK